MPELTPEDLLSLEQYAAQRPAFRKRMLAHRRRRRVVLGEHATLHFEDRHTIQYQIQEMLHIERVFEPDGIHSELAAYNPLIPDARNLKATLMLEYADPQQRRAALTALVGIEHRIWLRVAGHARVWAIADEDLPRSDAGKTAAVHFLRFPLEEGMSSSLRGGAALALGCDHPAYAVCIDEVARETREALAADLLDE